MQNLYAIIKSNITNLIMAQISAQAESAANGNYSIMLNCIYINKPFAADAWCS